MKKFFKYFAGIAAAAALFACSPYEDFKTAAYVVIDASVMECTEGPYTASGADTLVAIPVWLKNCKTGTTVTYTVTDDTATKGTDYTLVDNSGVLTFDPGVDSLAIEVKITGQPGVFTNSVKFNVELVSATNDVAISAFNKCAFTIKDLDHPLSAMLGSYTIDGRWLYYSNGSVYKFSAVDFAEITISPDSKDPTKVWFNEIGPAFYLFNMGEPEPFYGIVSSDMKTIKIPYGQGFDIMGEYPVKLCPVDYNNTDGVFVGEFKDGDAITFTLDETATARTYKSSDSWDLFDLDKDGKIIADSWYTPVLGSLFNAAWETVITKK